MRSVRGMRIASVFAVGGLVLSAAACGEAPDDDNNAGSGDKKYSACMVTDVGGIDDKSFNASAWKGLEEAKTGQRQHRHQVRRVQGRGRLRANLTQYVNQKCDFILAVGGLMGDATEKIAEANPNQQFGIVDAKPGHANVYPMQFDTAQAGFLAGYLAAGMTKSGKVGTYGGLPIPPVTIFMDGFADGVAHYNKTKSKNVQVARLGQGHPEGLLHQRLRQAGRGQEGQRRAGRPGRRHHHAGRRWRRPRHHRRGARPRAASTTPSGSTSTAARAPRTARRSSPPW